MPHEFLPTDEQGHVLAWRNDVEDKRSLVAHCLTLRGQDVRRWTAPRSIDHRKWLRIEDQGPMGACSGHARTTVEEVCTYAASGGKRIRQFSRFFAYLTGQRESGGDLFGRDCGATISGQERAAKRHGTALEDLFPYVPQYSTRIPDAAVADAATRKIRATVKLAGYDAAYEFLARGIGGVVIGLPWTEEMSRCQGVLNRVSGRVVGGHAVAWTGYLHEADGGKCDGGKPYVLIPNSWGDRWGNHGWALMTPKLVDWVCRSPDCEAIGFSDLDDPNDPDFTQRSWWDEINPFD